MLTSLLPPIQSFEHGLVLLATLIRGGGGGAQTQDRGRPFKPKYGTVSQVLLQLVAVMRSTEYQATIPPKILIIIHNYSNV